MRLFSLRQNISRSFAKKLNSEGKKAMQRGVFTSRTERKNKRNKLRRLCKRKKVTIINTHATVVVHKLVRHHFLRL
jgi:glutamate 5-kinase